MEIICGDSLVWIKRNREFGHVITSIPSSAEVGIKNHEEYRKWFTEAARLCFVATKPGCITVFVQTDELYKGGWFSKPEILFELARVAEQRLIWHKIELRRAVNKIDLRRPGYRHILAFGPYTSKSSKRSPDCFPPESTLYSNACGLRGVSEALRLAKINDPAAPVLDPFCGQGTIPKLATDFGMTAVGVDIDEAQCEKARQLLSPTNLFADEE